MRIVGKIIFSVSFIVISLGAFYNAGCNTKHSDIVIDIGKDAFAKLSDYNLFKGNMADLIPNGRLLPYDLITPLFSDYAEKARFVWVPEGKPAIYNADKVLELPVGSVLVKNFYYPADFRDKAKGRRIMETRLLIHREDGWDAETYIWNKEQTEATRQIVGAQIPMSFIDAKGNTVSFSYSVPNKNQCAGCHDVGGKIMPIGPKARNLNMDYTYEGVKQNQLDKWVTAGFLRGIEPKETIPHLVKWNDASAGSIDKRARGYLDVNCAHCHNPKGPAKNYGLDLSYTNTDFNSYGINKVPIAAGAGAGDNLVDIAPGKPDNSILIHRLESVNPEVMMPEIGRSLVHTEGVALIREWIGTLKPIVK